MLDDIFSTNPVDVKPLKRPRKLALTWRSVWTWEGVFWQSCGDCDWSVRQVFYRLCCQHKVEPRDFLTGCPFKTTHTHTKKNFRRDRGGTAGKVVVFTLSLHQGHCGHARFLSTGTPYCLICAFVYLFVLLFFFFFFSTHRDSSEQLLPQLYSLYAFDGECSL